MPLRSWRVAAAVAYLCSLLAAVALGAPAARAQDRAVGAEVRPGGYIVVLKDQPRESAARSVKALDAVPGVAVEQRYTSLFDGFSAVIDPTAADELANDPSVAAVYPDRILRAVAQTLPTGVDRVDADKHPTKAGDGGGSAVNVDIAIVDTGVSRNSDLNVAGGVNCTGGGSSYDDDNFHGTFVAGLAAAKDNGVGIVGAAPGARVWGVKVLGSDGQGYTSWILCGLDWVAARSGTIEVANLSLGGKYPYSTTCGNDVYHAAFCELYDRGVTVVVAAGNASEDARDYEPAKYPEVITVSALADSDGEPGGDGGYTSSGPDDSLADFSNFGSVVDISAPGVDLVSLRNASSGTTGGYGYSGTSFSSPLVAGGAALVLRDNPGSSPSSVKRRLLEASQHGRISGDPDSSPEPVMSVGFLGRGNVSAPSGGKPGDVVPVKVSNFAAGSKVYVKFDGDSVGSVVANEDGEGTVQLTVPITPRGFYEIEATNVRKADTTSFSVRPRISLSTRSGAVDAGVNVTLRGFAKGESILLTFDTGPSTRSLVRVTASSSGSASASFVAPSSTAGSHLVAAEGNRGNETSTAFTTRASVRARAASANRVDIELRGFRSGETVGIRWDDPAGTVATTTVLSTGSKSLTVTIPVGSDAGSHTVTADGTSNDATTTVSQPTATDVRTATPRPSTTSPTAGPEPAATETAIAAPTQTEAAPTETATAVPTETAVPTDVPPTETSTPTQEPTATDVPATETPTAVPTETSTEEPVP